MGRVRAGSRPRGRHRRSGRALVTAVIAVAGLCLAMYAVSGRHPGTTDAADEAATGGSSPAAVLTGGGTGSAGGTGPAGTGSAGGPDGARTSAQPPPAGAARVGTPAGAGPTRTTAPSAARRTAGAHSAATGTADAAAPRPSPGTRLFTLVNRTAQTIWPASGEQTAQPALATTGWVLPPGRTLTVRVPDHWNGRFWARTGCVFDTAGRGHCETGDCGGVFRCRGYGAIPATLAEFNLNAWDGLDFYDVSLVDGANVPMYINLVGGTTKDPISADGCSAAGCTHAVSCPAELRVAAGGRTVGCGSACAVFDTDQYCCRGQWADRSRCRPDQWPVDYAAVFKKAEPFAYSYADDDATSTFTSKGEAGYRITFGATP